MIYFRHLYTKTEAANRNAFIDEFKKLCAELHDPAGLALVLSREAIPGQETYFIQTPIDFESPTRRFSSRYFGVEFSIPPWPGNTSLVAGKF
jgi:hypothetical protein